MTKDLIYSSKNSKVFIEEDENLGKVVVKYLNEEYPPPKIIKQFFNEYDILNGLTIDGIRKALEWKKVHNKYSISLEHIEGQTFRDFIASRPPLKNLLSVFASVAHTLAELHRLNVIHKDISPGNILVSPQKLDTTLIDFGISTKLNIKTQHLGNPNKLEGTLAYISPEQTGRLNRVVDYRSDLYSFGVVMYEALAGQLPFQNEDPLEVVHGHIAVIATPVHEINPKIPTVLSSIIGKLMEKNAEDRYQSASGLRQDLEKCIEILGDHGTIDHFEIAKNDIRDKFQIIEKLYGRDLEIKTLMDCFDGVSKGPAHLVLVSGYSGTGKSALVAEIFKPVTEKKGYFIDGKYDQYQKGVPYSAILQAFNGYVNLLLTEDEDKLNEYRDEIQNAVGEEGRVLTELIPSLELIIGEQPEVPEINGVEARNRFKYIFQKFLETICSEEHPIVLFIDDLQWADSASLDLLNALLQDRRNEYFMCICAYRDNEVNKAHPFIIMVDELKSVELSITEIHIENLRFEDVHLLIAESLNLGLDVTESLAKMVHDKTQGNAFFVTQFLKSLYEDGVLAFSINDGRWKWDLDKMKEMDITDNVVEFMASKIKKTDPHLQEILVSAASVGNTFHVRTLAIIHEEDEKIILGNLNEALAEGWILYLEDYYRFAHDRIQQAVYSLVSEEKRNKLHLDIGRHLLEKYQDDQLDDNLFDVVNQLNQGVEYVTDESEKISLSDLNLQACQKSKLNSAFGEAYNHAKLGITLLGDDLWKKYEDKALKLYLEAAETAFLSADFTSMNQFIDRVLEYSDDILTRVRVYEIRINAFKAENKLNEALSTGFDVLNQLGEKFPKKAGPLTVMPDLLKTIMKLRGKDQEYIVGLPDMEDEEKKAALRILANIAPSSYWADPAVFPHIILRIVQLSLKHGLSAVSAFGFATYGVIQVGVLGKNAVGYKFGKIGLKILERFNAKEWIPQVFNPIYGLIFIWGDHVKTTLKPLLESYHIGLETGAIEFACINSNLYCINSFLIGKPLKRLEEETNAYSRTYEQYKQEINTIYNEVYRQAMLNFMGENEDPIKLIGAAFNEEEMLANNIEEKTRTGTFYIYFLRIILANYFGDPEYAWDNIEKAEPLLDSVLAKLELAHYAFFVGLTAAKYYPSAKGKSRSKALKLLKNNIKKLKKWAEFSPENYEHKLLLLEAELAVINKDNSSAIKLFDKSIMQAAEFDYLNEEAIANERAGHFHLNDGNQILGEFYIKNAYQTYRYWGAEAKLKHMAATYPNFIIEIKSGTESMTTTTTTTTTSTQRAGSAFDLRSIIKASTALSSEIVLPKLLAQLIQIVAENVGASRATLLLSEKQRLYIEAEYHDLKLVEEKLLKSIPLDISEDLPKSVIKFVRRTKNNVIISKAVEDPTFAKDIYIQEQKPKSILAFPIINKGNLIGIFYLENNVTEGAFTEDSIYLINLLSGQIAVSIENARLYEQLEHKVEERTQELAEEKKKSDDLLLNILPSQTAQELKKDGKATPRRYESVTVLFTDFIGFTRVAESLNPEELVDQIDVYFKGFDKISKKYQVEKIKTIGDSYMCAAGLPIEMKDHAWRAVKAASEMKEFSMKIAENLKKQGKPHFQIRIGLSSGPVVAGVVGIHKFAYDVWGDTVNTASRMESGSEPDKINISESTYELIKDNINSTYRGKIEVKNKGEIDMYFVDSLKN